MTETKRATANQSVDRSAETAAEESALGKARERANLALMRTRKSANALADRAADQVENTPLAAVAGGIAVGAIAGLLLPKTQQEVQLLGSLGQKINEGAISAAKAAGEAGKAELTAAGLSKVGANEQLGKLLESVGKAARSAGAAARESRRAKG